MKKTNKKAGGYQKQEADSGNSFERRLYSGYSGFWLL
jgi:hypothetical protein